jgi:hypothetical protein
MTLKSTMIAAAFALGALQFSGASAHAAPMPAAGLAKSIAVDQTGLQQVHWRPYRHCHWRWGRRYCHGGYRPRVGLYFGPGYYYGYRHHHRHFRHHRWRRR